MAVFLECACLGTTGAKVRSPSPGKVGPHVNAGWTRHRSSGGTNASDNFTLAANRFRYGAASVTAMYFAGGRPGGDPLSNGTDYDFEADLHVASNMDNPVDICVRMRAYED